MLASSSRAMIVVTSSIRPHAVPMLQRGFASCSSCLAEVRATASSSQLSRRSSRFAARPGADAVGPPDSLSNLRPIRYGSAFEDASSLSSSGSGAASGTASTLNITHPYSLHEFTSASTSNTSGSAWSSRAKGKGRVHSAHFERLLQKLEEAELAHKLRMARADNFNQRFWQDNNARFIQALSGFRSRTGSSKAVATLPSADRATHSKSTSEKDAELDLDSDSLATFYSAWLKANAARHRAYNRQLWAQTFGDLAPAARYRALRVWAKLVASLERRLGRS